MLSFKSRAFFCFLFLFVLALPGAQGNIQSSDEASFVGMTIGELIDRFGIPSSVYPVRGLQEWQDDVVFVYDEGDFYIFKDRVWQIGLSTYMGINTGDSGSVVPHVMDSAPGFSELESRHGSVSYSMTERSWPMILRCDFDDAGMVRGIFIFRSDL